MKKIALLLGIVLLNSCSSDDDMNVTSFPLYGNYCGSDRPGMATASANPIDMTDFLCEEHDACYAQHGFMNRKCDEILVNEVKKLKPKSPQEEMQQKMLRSYFKKVQKIK
jgi:hypothetical protein